MENTSNRMANGYRIPSEKDADRLRSKLSGLKHRQVGGDYSPALAVEIDALQDALELWDRQQAFINSIKNNAR